MKISIPKPCSENWNQMSPSEKGRFCTACQKQVVNFKEMPNESIKDFLEQETGATCGRFSRYQIETFNATYQELPSPSKLREWTMAAVLAGVSALPTFAQDSYSALPAPVLNTSIFYYHNQPHQIETTTAVPTGDTIVLVGKVISLETNENIPFATIIVSGTKIGTSTDLDGKFLLKVPKSKEAINLEVHYIGYSTLFYSIVPDSTQTNLVLTMDEEHAIMGEPAISRKTQRAYNRSYKKQLRAEQKRKRANPKE